MFNRYQLAAELISYQTLKISMKRWRSGRYPRSPPRTMDEFANQLEDNPHLLTSGTVKLKTVLVEPRNGKKSLIFFDENFISTKFHNVESLFADATYSTTPNVRQAYQVFTILGIRQNHVRIIIFNIEKYYYDMIILIN